jgi:hypothetical protein
LKVFQNISRIIKSWIFNSTTDFIEENWDPCIIILWFLELIFTSVIIENCSNTYIYCNFLFFKKVFYCLPKVTENNNFKRIVCYFQQIYPGSSWNIINFPANNFPLYLFLVMRPKLAHSSTEKEDNTFHRWHFNRHILYKRISFCTRKMRL